VKAPAFLMGWQFELRQIIRRNSAQQLFQSLCIAKCATLKVIVEIRPYFCCAASFDFFGPCFKLGLGIIMPIPLGCAVETDINHATGCNKVIWQPWRADRAENNARLLESVKNIFIPPTAMPELDGVAPVWLQLLRNGRKPRRRVMVTWRQLKQKTTHACTQHICKPAEFTN